MAARDQSETYSLWKTCLMFLYFTVLTSALPFPTGPDDPPSPASSHSDNDEFFNQFGDTQQKVAGARIIGGKNPNEQTVMVRTLNFSNPGSTAPRFRFFEELILLDNSGELNHNKAT
jgi:hypothetical protein